MLMTIDQIKEMVLMNPDYGFIRTDPRLKDRMILLTIGGSYSYGTASESSDVDIRGIALNSPSDIIGYPGKQFETVVRESVDCTVYSFMKYVELLASCNPNILEMMGNTPEKYIILTDIGRDLMDNYSIFISAPKVAGSFGDYARNQLRRLVNALAHDRISQEAREEHIRQSMQSAIDHFKGRYDDVDGETIHIYTDKNESGDMDIYADIDMKRFPARRFNSVINDLHNVIRTYDKLNHRNNKKDDYHLNKHAMHIVRLLLTGTELLETGVVRTQRDGDLDLLNRIRNGFFMNDDGTYKPEFNDLIDSLEKKFNYAKEHTVLPQHYDATRVNEFVMAVNRRVVNGDI